VCRCARTESGSHVVLTRPHACPGGVQRTHACRRVCTGGFGSDLARGLRGFFPRLGDMSSEDNGVRKGWRTGRWGEEELRYLDVLRKDFEDGVLDTTVEPGEYLNTQPSGASLRISPRTNRHCTPLASRYHLPALCRAHARV
jgi:hypothetical protein